MISCSIDIQIEDETISFPPTHSQKLSACSELIRSLMEERDDLDPDNTDSILVTIDTHDFRMEHIRKTIDYLEHHNYNPPKYGKIISHDLRKNLADVYDSDFALGYTILTIKPIHACAEY
jgi:hypothetical protein